VVGDVRQQLASSWVGFLGLDSSQGSACGTVHSLLLYAFYIYVLLFIHGSPPNLPRPCCKCDLDFLTALLTTSALSTCHRARGLPNHQERMTHAGMKSHKQSSFLHKLPAEIRCHIYELVFKDGEAECVTYPANQRCRTLPSGWMSREAQSMELLLTCSQIHREAIPLFYQHTYFRFRLPQDFLAFYDRSDAKLLDHIRHIELHHQYHELAREDDGREIFADRWQSLCGSFPSLPSLRTLEIHLIDGHTCRKSDRFNIRRGYVTSLECGMAAIQSDLGIDRCPRPTVFVYTGLASCSNVIRARSTAFVEFREHLAVTAPQDIQCYRLEFWARLDEQNHTQ